MVSVRVYLTEADFGKYLNGERVEGAFVTVNKDMAVEIQVPLHEVTVRENKAFFGARLVAILNDK